MGNVINHPDHYQLKNGMEVIDIISAVTDIESVCKGNIIKYICREEKKNGIEDLKKADWYLQYLIAYKQRKINAQIDNYAESIGGQRNGEQVLSQTGQSYNQ